MKSKENLKLKKTIFTRVFDPFTQHKREKNTEFFKIHLRFNGSFFVLELLIILGKNIKLCLEWGNFLTKTF